MRVVNTSKGQLTLSTGTKGNLFTIDVSAPVGVYTLEYEDEVLRDEMYEQFEPEVIAALITERLSSVSWEGESSD